jgi:hypothetical protein
MKRKEEKRVKVAGRGSFYVLIGVVFSAMIMITVEKVEKDTHPIKLLFANGHCYFRINSSDSYC